MDADLSLDHLGADTAFSAARVLDGVAQQVAYRRRACSCGQARRSRLRGRLLVSSDSSSLPPRMRRSSRLAPRSQGVKSTALPDAAPAVRARSGHRSGSSRSGYRVRRGLLPSSARAVRALRARRCRQAFRAQNACARWACASSCDIALDKLLLRGDQALDAFGHPLRVWSKQFEGAAARSSARVLSKLPSPRATGPSGAEPPDRARLDVPRTRRRSARKSPIRLQVKQADAHFERHRGGCPGCGRGTRGRRQGLAPCLLQSMVDNVALVARSPDRRESSFSACLGVQG
jgi:hypothetical protein